MSKEIKENLERMLKFQEDCGELALFYEIGMPKYYNLEKIKNLFERIFKDKINPIKLILIYGSKKPYSDIDLFIVSEKIKDFMSNWLDIYSLSPKQFEYSVSVFDIAVTDPLLTGEFVFGDREYLEQKKWQLQKQAITWESIYYNVIKGKEQKNLVKDYPKNSKEWEIRVSYSETYVKNALALRQGKRKLTKTALYKL
jgi:hypothetical protein